MKTNSILASVRAGERPGRTPDRPEPEEAYRLLQAFWNIEDRTIRARLLREAETAAKSGHCKSNH